jgi:uncharacterized protein (DUF2236 family)
MPSPWNLLVFPAREPIRRWVLSAFPRGGGGHVDYDHPLGDPGLFGPHSATWRVHADFPGMLAGGLAALMLQTLHPQALAGVWDHSNFRDDLIGRLRRTTSFVSGTSYAPNDQALALIERVKTIHAQVRGTTEDARPYSADDPHLLTWVHVTEAYSFLQGYRRYSHMRLPTGAADRYYDEVRRVAEALGAREVPASEAQVNAYFRQVRPDLHFSERSRVVLDVLSCRPGPKRCWGARRCSARKRGWRHGRCGRWRRCFGWRCMTALRAAPVRGWAWRRNRCRIGARPIAHGGVPTD